MSLLYKGDIGATITINLKITNIPITTDISVFAETPTGATVEWVLENGELDLVDGIITHKTKAGELPLPGDYRVQCIEKDTGIDLGSSIDKITVYSRLGTL